MRGRLTAWKKTDAPCCATRRKAMSNDRYEKIRKALAMGPTPGPRRAVEQSVIGPQDLSILFAKVTFSVGINGSHSVPIEEAIANAALAAACDPDTIRELLAERDQLAAALEAVQMGFRYAVRVWVLTDEIVLSEKKIDEVIESIIGDAKKEAGND